jgi:uncharacterized protein YejL (UPF0352 family)
VRRLHGEGLNVVVEPRAPAAFEKFKTLVACEPGNSYVPRSLAQCFLMRTGARVGAVDHRCAMYLDVVFEDPTGAGTARRGSLDSTTPLRMLALRHAKGTQTLIRAEEELLEAFEATLHEIAPDLVVGPDIDEVLRTLERRAEVLGHPVAQRLGSLMREDVLQLRTALLGKERAKPSDDITDVAFQLGMPFELPHPGRCLKEQDRGGLRKYGRAVLTIIDAAWTKWGPTWEALLRLCPVVPGVAFQPSMPELFDRLFVERAIRAGDAVPPRIPVQKQETTEKALIAKPTEGLASSVFHLDISAAYPTAVAKLQLGPRQDHGGHVEQLLAELIAARSAAAGGTEQALKLLANVATGLLGSNESRFYDPEQRGRMVERVASVMRSVKDGLEQRGYTVDRIETDGVYASGDAKLSDRAISTLAHDLIQEACRSVDLPDDTFRMKGEWIGPAIFTPEGVATGGRMKGRPFLSHREGPRLFEQILNELVEAVLEGREEDAQKQLRESVEAIRARTVAPIDLAQHHRFGSERLTFVEWRDVGARAGGVLPAEDIALVMGERGLVTADSPEASQYDVHAALASLRAHLAGLRDVLDLEAAGLPGPLPTTRIRSHSRAAARQRRKRERKQLPILQPTPCLRSVQSSAEVGDPISWPEAAKAAYEFRQSGGDRREFVGLLRRGPQRGQRYVGKLLVRGPDGRIDVRHELWPDDPADHRYRGCSSSAVKGICDFSDCDRSRRTSTWDPSKSPSAEHAIAKGRITTRYAIAKAIKQRGVTAVEVPPRSGKTTRLAQEAWELAKAGQRVLIAAPTHDALDEVSERLGRSPPEKRLAVHVVGRRTDSCLKTRRKGCTGCGHDLRDNKLIPVSPAEGVQSLAAIRKAAATAGTCARSVALRWARDADVVLAPHAYLGLKDAKQLLGGKRFRRLFVDEADRLIDATLGKVIQMPLASSRRDADSPLKASCDRKCDSCAWAYVQGVEGGTPRPEPHVGAVGDDGRPDVLLDALEDGLDVLGHHQALAAYLDLKTLAANVSALKATLRALPASGTPYDLDLEGAGDGGVEGGVWLRTQFVECVKPSVPRKPVFESDRGVARSQQELVSKAKLAKAQLSAEDRRAVGLILAFAEFSDGAARRCAGRAMIVPLLRPISYPARWRSYCELRLMAFEVEQARSTVRFLRRHDAVLVSGTMPDDVIVNAWLRLGSKGATCQVDRRLPPLHDGLTIVQHGIHHTHRTEPYLPRSFKDADVATLLVELLSRKDRAWRVAAFAKSKKAKAILEGKLREHDSLDRALVEHFRPQRGARRKPLCGSSEARTVEPSTSTSISPSCTAPASRTTRPLPR